MTAALLLALSLSAPAGAAEPISLPLLPVHARLDSDGPSPFCASSELKRNLRSWAFAGIFSRGETSPVTDLVVSCARVDETLARITVTDRDGAPVESFKTLVSASSGDFENIAFLVARRLAKGRKTIEAALVAHRSNLRYSAAQRGAQALADGDWTTAAGSLYAALESDASPAPLYYGLYVAHAKLGSRMRARWYLLLFCEEIGKRPDELPEAQLAALRSMVRAERADDGYAAAPAAEWRRLTAQKRGYESAVLLKAAIERAPWLVEGHLALADAYEAIGWGPLEDGWRRRGRLARKAQGRTRNHESLDRLENPE